MRAEGVRDRIARLIFDTRPTGKPIRDRIADVIGSHTPAGGVGRLTCWCGIEEFHSYDDHSRHVADMVVGELGL